MAGIVTSKNKSSKGFLSTNFVLGYYLVLGVIQALWTSQTSFPPMVMRLGMIALVVAPMFFKREIIPFVFIYSITLRQYLATSYSYLPDIYSVELYIILLIILLIYHYGIFKHKGFHNKGAGVLLFMVVYWSLVDLMYNGTIGHGAYFYLLAFVLLLFYDSRDSLEYGIAGYVLSSLLAVYYFINYRSFAVSYSTVDIERSGWSDPNYFSLHLGIGSLFCMCLLFKIIQLNRIILKKYFLIAGGLITFLAIVATGSRAGFIASLSITFISLLFSKTASKNRLFAVFAIVFVLIYVLRSQYAQLILYRLSEEQDFDTAGSRTVIWTIALSNFWTQSFEYLIFGGGWLHRFKLTNGLETHNELVGVLCDYGIIGILTLFTLYLRILSNLVYRKMKEKLYVPFIYLLLMIITLSPSQFPLMPMFTAWLIASYRLKMDDSVM